VNPSVALRQLPLHKGADLTANERQYLHMRQLNCNQAEKSTHFAKKHDKKQARDKPCLFFYAG
jgi:hypothetical protein